jgi:hypothetical protein
MIDIRTAELADYDVLRVFYEKAYRVGHPLLSASFFEWQFGDIAYGTAIIAVENNRIIGHLGCSFADGLTWLTNLFILETHRSGPLVLSMYSKAKSFGLPLVTTNASSGLIAFYRRLKWYRQPNLERYCAINPQFTTVNAAQLIEPMTTLNAASDIVSPSGHWYWLQPGMAGAALSNGSTAVVQPNCAGVRLVDLKRPAETAEQFFAMGYRWIDYVTSWNDPVIDQLQTLGWQQEKDTLVPWYLNPVVAGSKSEITVFSNTPLPKDFIIKRYHSDHGRVASL